MSAYRLLRRLDYEDLVATVPLAVQRKAAWAQVLLGTRGRTPTVKSTTGLNAAWRRTPVQGSHYYLWWIPAADTNLHFNGDAARPAAAPAPAILVHSIRHHDETDRALEVGLPGDYEAVEVGLLDPRFEEQSEVGSAADAQGVTFNLIEGMPGSGKSVALIYLARDLTLRPGINKVRYVTYTERLKRSAREIFDGLGPEIARHITVHTLNDVVKDLLSDKHSGPLTGLVSTPYAELRSFGRDLETLNPRDVGPWRDFPLTLYTELRAEVVGRTFPQGYQLPRHRDEQLRRRGGQIDVERYARMRGLELRAAEAAVALGERLRGRYFTDQVLAAQALEKVLKGDLPNWLAHTDAIIVDEVQDLTLLQIALIGEMAHLRRTSLPERAFALTIAGDESQIVQPTGFKWGVTKDLLAERVGVYATRHEFGEQRRSPPLLARIIDGSWSFYAALPKELRPSARQGAPMGELAAGGAPDAEPGLAILLQPPAPQAAAAQWRSLLAEVSSRPGRAVIDLTEDLAEMLSAGAERGVAAENEEAISEVLFAAREIKGLERATILVHGLGQVYDRVVALIENEDGTIIPQMEARRLIDQMRVALSRSTSRIVFVESPDAPVFAKIGFDPATDAIALGWSELLEFLQADTMTELELVSGLLDEAEELADRSRMEDALRRNRRAAAIAQRAGSPDAVAQARRQFATLKLRHAEELLEANALAQAQETFEALVAVADALPDESYSLRMAELQDRLTAASDSLFDKLLEQSRHALDALEYAEAYAAAQRALSIAQRAATSDRTTRARAAASAATSAWSVALAATATAAHSAHIAELLSELSTLQAHTGAASLGQVSNLLARRYRQQPERQNLGAADVRQVLALAAEALAAQPANGDAASHLHLWLEESFVDLGTDATLYFAWARTAAALAASSAYAELDEHLWDLENRLALAPASADLERARFVAFLADYNADFARASLLWEQLGDMEPAIESARNAGDIERAYALLRKNNPSHMPDAVSTAVKAVRLLQQMQQKHHHLYPAERRALLEELARLHAALEKGNE